jgi:uncharacterized protein (UPF0332 family)
MINESERQFLISYRLQQADDTIELAEFLKDSNKLVVSVNRIYYGMYYSLTALALKHKFETSRHAQLMGWFNKEFVSTGKIDKKFGKSLRNAFQNRTKGDYDAFIDFSMPEVENMLQEMKDFVFEKKNDLIADLLFYTYEFSFSGCLHFCCNSKLPAEKVFEKYVHTMTRIRRPDNGLSHY